MNLCECISVCDVFLFLFFFIFIVFDDTRRLVVRLRQYFQLRRRTSFFYPLLSSHFPSPPLSLIHPLVGPEGLIIFFGIISFAISDCVFPSDNHEPFFVVVILFYS